MGLYNYIKHNFNHDFECFSKLCVADPEYYVLAFLTPTLYNDSVLTPPTNGSDNEIRAF
jgi:hypothetical protein